jgi:DNA adenine methylase
LADSNADLINVYRLLKAEGRAFIQDSQAFFTAENNTLEAYYALRQLFNTTSDIRLKALLFIYLNRHGYNGLCRYNSRGEFNAPFGKYIKPYFPAKEMLHFYLRAKRAVFKHADFEQTMRSAKRGDVIYCDPPYLPLSATANFTQYSSKNFAYSEQLTLAKWAKRLSKRGIPVLISNHATEQIQQFYAPAKVMKFDVQRFISCKGSQRKKVSEVLAYFPA